MDMHEEMTSPQQAPAIADRGKDTEKSGEIIQAGRSDSTLNAEQNLAEVRTGKPSPASDPSLPDTSSSQSTNVPPEASTSPPGASLGRRASYVPRKFSPLNPLTSAYSVSSNSADESDGSTASDEMKPKQSPGRLPNGGALPRINIPRGPLTPMQELLRQKSTPNIRPQTLERFKDLERRYSRYPLIGQDSRRELSYMPQIQSSSTMRLLESRPSAVSLTATNPSSGTTLARENEKWGLVDDMSSFNPYCGREKGFILYVNEVEDDDDYHMPKDDDDLVFKSKFRDYFHGRVIVSTIGAIFLIIGIFSLFI